jgi:hypothetical protein
MTFNKRSKIILVTSLLVFNCLFVHSGRKEMSELSGKYFGQKRPGLTPVEFAPDVFSGFKYAFCSVFSPDGNEFYFAAAKSEADKPGIYWMRRIEDKWTKPEPVPFNSTEIDHDMRISADGFRIFFQSWRPLPGSSIPDETGLLWFSVRTENGWGEPTPVKCGNNILRAAYPDISYNGTLYFSMRDKNTRNVDIHRSRFINGAYGPPENLGSSINTEYFEADLCVSTDESYIIVACWERPDNIGGEESDLYISFCGSDGNWTRLINMGETVNTKHIENCPTISPDGRFFFFQRFDRAGKSKTFWVSAKIIERYKPHALKKR